MAAWWATGMALGLAVAAAPAAERQVFGVLRQFTWPDYYPPPHETQLRFLLKGGEAVPQAGGLLLVREVTLEKFQEDGARELLVSTPACQFNSAAREAGSAETLRVQFGEDRLVLEGRGFWWQQTNALLVVSNQVRTTLRGGWLGAQPGASPTLGDVEILAEMFRYDGRASEAEYRGRVRVSSTNLNLAAGRLAFLLPAAGPGRVQRMTLEQDVTVEFGPLRASGDEAVYLPEEDRVRLAGHAVWQAADRQGTARELLLDRATRALRAQGEATLKLRLPDGGLLARATGAPAAGERATPDLVISAAQYEVLTNTAKFAGGVEAREQSGDATVARLRCAALSVTLDAANQPQHLEAEGGVTIEAAERRLSAARAEYSAPTGLLNLSGGPTWRDGSRSGQGQTLTLDWKRNRMTVRGQASLTLPQAEAARFFGALGGPQPPRTSPPGQTAGADTAQILCEEYTLGEDGAEFRGGVQVRAAQMQLTAATVDVTLATNGVSLARLVADRNIVMSLVETNGQTTRIACSRVVYSGADDTLELTGRPTVEQISSAMTNRFEAERMTLHRGSGQVSAQGRWSGNVLLPAETARRAAERLPGADKLKPTGSSSR